jgi:hypothetical protein
VSRATRATRARSSTTPAKGSGRRLAVVYDVEPPHVRLGIAWFVLAVVALGIGVGAVALLFSVTAALAAYQAARCWRLRPPNRPDQILAAAIAAGMGMAATLSVGAVGLVLLVGTFAAVFRGFTDTKAPFVLTASRTLLCGVWPGGAAAGMVTAYRFELWVAVALLLAVSAYETGDYLVGSGSRTKFEGPIAGAVATMVVVLTIAAIGLPPFEISNALQFGLLAAVLCPAGQVVGSLVLPAAAAPAPALRRLDSWLLLAPAWAWIAGWVASTA